MPATLCFFERLVEWRNVGNLYEFAGPYPILQGGTAREAGSLPYKSVCENLPAKFQFFTAKTLPGG